MEINILSVAPEIVLSVVGIVLMMLIPTVGRARQAQLGYLALAGVVLALAASMLQWGARDVAFYGTIFQDDFAQYSKILFLAALGSIILISIHYLRQEELLSAEYFPLLLFSGVGMCLMAASADLIVTFLGLETLSIATYVLAGYRTKVMQSTEAAIKYFLLGAFSTAFLLYGVALVYGATGTTKYLGIAQAISQFDALPTGLLLGLGLMVVGFGFKIALAPFHIWAPDVYEGAPVPITAHLAVASKAAAVVAFLRILYQVAPELGSEWYAVLWVTAVLTMLIGNVAALAQTNIKRMLAYSSIAHAGYLMIGVTVHNQLGAQGVLFYLVAYALMSLGAFTVVQLIGRKNEASVQIEDYAGIGFRFPFLGLALSVFLVSLAGIPLTAGFAGKLFLFAAAIQSQMYWLVVFAVVASAIGVYYYLRVMVLMYMREAPGEIAPVDLPVAARVLLVVMIAGTLILGIFPGSILRLASEAMQF